MPKNIWQKSLVSHIWTFLIYIKEAEKSNYLLLKFLWEKCVCRTLSKKTVCIAKLLYLRWCPLSSSLWLVACGKEAGTTQTLLRYIVRLLPWARCFAKDLKTRLRSFQNKDSSALRTGYHGGFGNKTTVSDYLSALFLLSVLDLESVGLSFLYFFPERVAFHWKLSYMSRALHFWDHPLF